MPFPLVAAVAPQASNNSRQVSPLFIFSNLVSLSFPRNFYAAWVIFFDHPCAPSGAKRKRTFMPQAFKVGRKKLWCFLKAHLGDRFLFRRCLYYVSPPLTTTVPHLLPLFYNLLWE